MTRETRDNFSSDFSRERNGDHQARWHAHSHLLIVGNITKKVALPTKVDKSQKLKAVSIRLDQRMWTSAIAKTMACVSATRSVIAVLFEASVWCRRRDFWYTSDPTMPLIAVPNRKFKWAHVALEIFVVSALVQEKSCNFTNLQLFRHK